MAMHMCMPTALSRRRWCQSPANSCSMLRVFALVFVTLAAFSGVLAASNRTIDDQYGDIVTGIQPVYQPASAWNFGPDCSTCNVGPSHESINMSSIMNGTW
jgi:hypothetical protein